MFTDRKTAERVVACGYGRNSQNMFSPTAVPWPGVSPDDDYSVDLNVPSYDELSDLLENAFERDGKNFVTIPDSFRK